MTAEEKVRMNELSIALQEEKDYSKFASILQEMSELIERKEQRRFPQQPKIVWAHTKPWVSMTATATRLLPSVEGPDRRVEISISEADDLFREIRIKNQLTGPDGKAVALGAGVQLTVTLEAEPKPQSPR